MRGLSVVVLAATLVAGSAPCVAAAPDSPDAKRPKVRLAETSPPGPLPQGEGENQIAPPSSPSPRGRGPGGEVKATGNWPEFQIIEWQPRSPAELAALKKLGVTAGMATGARESDPAKIIENAGPLRRAGLRYYVENIATDFYSAYHRWVPGVAVNALFVRAQDAYRADPSSIRPLMREPSLSDPAWLARITARLDATVRATAADHPLYYSLGDETGIADLAAFWDFDLSDASLEGFRRWLRLQYGSLDALNREWGSHFEAWDAVVPETTRHAIAGEDDNFAAWADFKEWMDEAFARALRAGTDAVHQADKAALAGIEGTQVPGWGGYDYARLTKAVDLMEIYDSDLTLPLVRALNPDVVPLNTAFASSAENLHEIWHAWLAGSRGLILWDEQGDIVRPDGQLGERGRAYAPILRVLRGGVGTLVADSQVRYDPVAVLYSPASFRIQWMIENRPKGDAWMRGSSEADAQGNGEREALRDYTRALAALGLSPTFITPDQLAQGALGDAKALLLPHTVAMSDRELQTVRAFTAVGGVVIADSQPGLFDQHGHRRTTPPLADLVASHRVLTVPPSDNPALHAALGRVQIAPAFRVDAPDVRTYVLKHGDLTILGLQRTLGYGTGPERVQVSLPRPMYGVEAIGGKPLGRTASLSLSLDPITPAVIVLSDQPAKAPPG